MSMRPGIRLIVALALLSALGARGAEEPAAVSPELAQALSAAQADLRAERWQRAVTGLEGFQGEDHALRHLLLGHARLGAGYLDRAAASYARALGMDAGLREAGLGLIHVRVRQENWPEAARLMGEFVPPDSCDADMLALYAQVALNLRDRALARLLTEKGIVRFPLDLRLRRLELARLLECGDDAEAGRAIEFLLESDPADAQLWQQLAAVRNRAGLDGEARAALEAALLCRPDDLSAHRGFLEGQLAGGNWPTVLSHGQQLLDGPLADTARGDVALIELLVRAADQGQADGLLDRWLGLVPPDRRTPAMHVASARSALRRGRPADARASLSRLIEMGEADGSVLLWAGHLAEQGGDATEAETLYEGARQFTGASARLAVLYLARLHLRGERPGEAVRLLRAYLNDRPEDAPARALLHLAEDAASMSSEPPER